MTVAQRTHVSGIIGIGYEGRDIDAVVADLLDHQVTRLVDVRLTPISRKAGFSKTALGRTAQEAGIAYQHYPQLGNPKCNRAGFSGPPGELLRARHAFTVVLRQPAAARCLIDLAQAARDERIALLCYEADQERCHRDVVMRALAGMST